MNNKTDNLHITKKSIWNQLLKQTNRMNKTNRSNEPIGWIKPSLCHGDPGGFLKSFPLSGVMNLRFKLSSQGVCLSNPDPLQPLVPRPTHAPADACPDDQRFTAALNKTPRNETGHKMAPPPADIAGAGWARQERERETKGGRMESKRLKNSKKVTSLLSILPLFNHFLSSIHFFFCAFHFHTFYFPPQSFSSIPFSTPHENTYWGDKGRECREETGGCVWGMRESQEWNPVFPLHWA